MSNIQFYRPSAGHATAYSRNHQSVLSLPSISTPRPIRTELASAPLPQRQWADVPETFRPLSCSNYNSRNKPLPDLPAQTELYCSFNLSRSMPKRKPRLLNVRNGGIPPGLLQTDPCTSYPQMSPYDISQPSLSAPPDVQWFSYPATSPTALEASAGWTHFESADTIHYPTYPPSKHRGNDNVLRDEAEYGLFIEATAGLGPVPTFRQDSIIEDNWHFLSSRSREQQHRRSKSQPRQAGIYHDQSRDSSRYVVSSVGEVEGIARLPLSQSISARRQQRTERASAIVDIPDSRLREWLDSSTQHDPIDGWSEVHDPMPEDELPDYAASQAQLNIQRRVEATRRAQELQRRWRESGSRWGAL